jgi:hypothetical protein
MENFMCAFLYFVFFATVLLGITDAHAQFGGKQRGGGGSGESAKREAPRKDEITKSGPPPITDPMLAIEREMTSLRIDLKLTSEQSPFFDSFDREVRNVARVSRERTRQLAGFRLDDGSTVAATSIIATISDADSLRAESMRQVAVKLDALQSALTPDQRRQFDRRIVQSMREPLGNS